MNSLFYIFEIVFAAIVATLIYLYVFNGSQDNDQDYHALYKDCKLLEANHYNGFFSNNTNKLECDGVIYNVDTNAYNEAFRNHK